MPAVSTVAEVSTEQLHTEVYLNRDKVKFSSVPSVTFCKEVCKKAHGSLSEWQDCHRLDANAAGT